MKTLAKLLLSLAFVALLVNCEKDDRHVVGNYDPDAAKAFSAEFVVYDFSPVDGYYAAKKETKGCTRIWKGMGTSALFGDFSVEISMICFIQKGEICGDFCNLSGIITLNEGVDELYFFIPEGKIVCNSDDNKSDYETCFNDLAKITGGIGRFENVSGEFYPNALIHKGGIYDEWHADFKAEGFIKNYNYFLANPPEKTIIEEKEAKL